MDSTTALIVALLTASAAAVFIFIFLILRIKGEKKTPVDFEISEIGKMDMQSFRVGRSVSVDQVEKAREELRILELEREILSDAIRKLYEAHAEGKISEAERDKLLAHYRERMLTIKEAIDKNQSIVALHELEAMQEDLIKLFNERFDELNRKIEELRTKVQVAPIKEIKPIEITPPTPTPEKKAPAKTAPKKKRKKRERKEGEGRKSEAERRIEEIKAEIEKVLARLGQMEVEA
ncbi:hypothetical protein DRO54_05250 [Candidatus Bathyarchaeota archaeon]|nr:MAG: hypothetical protein DRO54_05250 [Candidatus Bathyarchaeota archaeon]